MPPAPQPLTGPCITRFAPSPTGLLHLGHAVAAIAAHDLAKANGGRFLLRIDDIDAGRCRPEFETGIYEDLTWLGLRWREPVRRQSDCVEEYRTALARLQEAGLVYPCFCTRKEIQQEAARAGQAPHGAEGPLYTGVCRRLSEKERAARLKTEAPFALRLDVTKGLEKAAAPLSFTEFGRGPQGQNGWIIAQPERLGDVILARGQANAIQQFSYHLAVVVDDASQGVTCVTRGQDLFFATPLHCLLQALLGLQTPAYLHHALALDETGKRLAKRHDALSLKQFRTAGVQPEKIRELALAVLG
jgi:glutamyl-Q tRNA(Asp) synthetase